MIVITIIGILASVVLGGLNSARTAAKIAKTKSLVTRLHYVVMEQYDSYRTRRPAMDLEAYAIRTAMVVDAERASAPSRAGPSPRQRHPRPDPAWRCPTGGRT